MMDSGLFIGPNENVIALKLHKIALKRDDCPFYRTHSYLYCCIEGIYMHGAYAAGKSA